MSGRFLLLLLPFLLGKLRSSSESAPSAARVDSPRSSADDKAMRDAAIAAAIRYDANVSGGPDEPWMWFVLPSGKRVRIVIRNGVAVLPR